MIYLLFGRFYDCLKFVYQHDKNISYIHVNGFDKYAGLDDVALVWCGPYDVYYHNLYEEAEKYFKLRGKNFRHE